jgi:hypothetical protein
MYTIQNNVTQLYSRKYPRLLVPGSDYGALVEWGARDGEVS